MPENMYEVTLMKVRRFFWDQKDNRFVGNEGVESLKNSLTCVQNFFNISPWFKTNKNYYVVNEALFRQLHIQLF